VSLAVPGNAASPATTRGMVTALLPIMAVVLSAFSVAVLAMPVFPLHVHQGLGRGVPGAAERASTTFVALLRTTATAAWRTT
jgi:hypothetical protein